MIAALALLLATVLSAAPPADDAVTRERLEGMLDRGETALVVQVFRRHRGSTLPFIDSYLEGGLKIIEEGGDAEVAHASLMRGVAFAELSAQALEDRTIYDYAASFASWSPKEQKRFRAGQAAYRTGRAAERDGETQGAYDSYRESQRLAKSLGDTWGDAMAAAGVARTVRELGRPIESIGAGREAVTLYRRLALEGSEVQVLLGLGEMLEQQEARRGGLPDFSRAWFLVRGRDAGDELRRKVYDAYMTALRKRGDSSDNLANIGELMRDAGYEEPAPVVEEEGGGS